MKVKIKRLGPDGHSEQLCELKELEKHNFEAFPVVFEKESYTMYTELFQAIKTRDSQGTPILTIVPAVAGG